MLKRHAIRRFDVMPAPNGATAGAICAQLEGVLFDGSEVAYTLEGECCVAAAGERILALFWDGVPAVRTAYADQRSYEWAPVQKGGEGWPGTDGGGGLASGGGELGHLTPTPQASAALHMRSSCSRAMAPAEVLAYELNKGSAVHARPTSDALTIVARSLVAGALPPAGLVERAVSQVVRRNPLLTARTLVIADGRHLFVRDQLSSSRAVSAAPAATRALTAAALPCSAARCSGVLCVLSIASSAAPAPTRASMASTWPIAAAPCRAVRRPTSPCASTAAPAATSTRIAATWPPAKSGGRRQLSSQAQDVSVGEAWALTLRCHLQWRDS